MFIWFYRIIFLPLWVLTLPGYFLHMRKRGGYRDRFGTRFGKGLRAPAKPKGVKRIWIQAVSLGEMLAIEPLLKRLASEKRIEIYLTVTTSTGYALAREKYSEIAVGISYFPVDWAPFSRSVWNQIDADVAICAETELWPEHLRQAELRGIPFLLVNGRLSDRSFRRAKRFGWAFEWMLKRVTRVFACSEQDGERFRELGGSQESVEVTGNIKVDVVIEPVLDAATKSTMRGELGLGDGFLLLGSSTWPGEEEMLLEALRELRARDLRARLLIVPRHAERRHEIEAMLRAQAGAYRWHFKSRGTPQGEVDILIGDTHGELRVLTQLADLAFVGKSLPPHAEGQTPVECGALGVPMVFGTGMSNFRAIRDGLLQFGAAREVASADEAVGMICALAEDESRRREMSQGGKAWHARSRGAVERTAVGVIGFLTPHPATQEANR